MAPAAAETTVVLLAHQDDDIAFAPLIRRVKARGAPVRIVYLTDGGAGRVSPAVRDAECRRALGTLGVEPDEVLFLGGTAGIPDGALFRHFDRAYERVDAAVAAAQPLGDIYTLAFEGGHVDHDGAHVVAAALAEHHHRRERAWQVPFYRAADRGPPWFSLFAPLAENGPVTDVPLTREEALLRAGLMRSYPSQWRVFLGLAPALMWHAARATPLKMQKLRLERLWERPMKGRLFYERSGISFDQFAAYAHEFLVRRVTTSPPPMDAG
jgi:LmbE family N-acetylglucosaminyl deacetylase